VTDTAKGLIFAAVLVVIAAALGVFIGLDRAPPAMRPDIYLVSVSRVSYRDADKWLIEYAMDGRPYQVETPVKKGEPDGYIAYLRTIGRVR
jgi:hypothetical protein